MNAATPQVEFFDALLEDIMFGAMIPKVQIERALGPILGFFLADVVRARNGKRLVMLCPEFPLRKLETYQSTNIDWLMYDQDANELVFVELKTTDSSVSQEQLNVYLDLMERIKNEGADFLYADLNTIGEKSLEAGKYAFVKSLMAYKLGAHPGLPKVADLFAGCCRASLIYIKPAVAKRLDSRKSSMIDWITFGELPQAIESRHADQWPSVRASLLALDTLDRKLRGGGDHSWNHVMRPPQ